MKTNNNDIKKEVLGITLKDSKNNKLDTQNTSLGITPLHPKTNNEDINVAKNVAQGNSQDLTEQYKTRTLQNNFYYFDNGKTQYIVEYHNIKGVEGLDGVKVLERVPGYEKWKSLNELLDSSLETNKALAHRLNICKELLKEFREYVVNTPVYPQGDNNKQAEIHRLVNKINEALK